MISAKIIEDTVAFGAKRLTTFQLSYPRMIHAEFMTHRVFSRNASSSRAIPVSKNIEKVLNSPSMPVSWGKNQKGMQASTELSKEEKEYAKYIWKKASEAASSFAQDFVSLGLHKQAANRILEPFLNIEVIVTATEWENFFALRCHPDADPTMQALAVAMKNAYDCSVPRTLKRGEMHLPYILPQEKWLPNDTLALVSAARCARVSYLNHDGTKCDLTKDIELAMSLYKSKHMSPFEHQAVPDVLSYVFSNRHKNFSPGWKQWRYEVENGRYEAS